MIWINMNFLRLVKSVLYEQNVVKINQNCTQGDEGIAAESIIECVLHCGAMKCMDALRDKNGRCYCVDGEKCRTEGIGGQEEATIYSTFQTPVTVQPICYEPKNTKYAVFRVPYNGKLKSIKLVSVSGGIECSTDMDSYGPSRWSCNHKVFTDDDFLTVVTNNQNEVLVPKGPYETYKFKIPGQDKNGKELLLVAENPIGVQSRDELRVWNTEDLYKTYEDDNVGRHCVHVYVKYC